MIDKKRSGHVIAQVGADHREVAVVRSVDAAGCAIEMNGACFHAGISTHLPGLQTGQKVLAFDGGPDAGWLVVAAWPMDAAQPANPIKFDSDTGTLHIQAARLSLSALAAIDLQCGEARIRLTLDGKAQIEGKEVLSAAIGANRIEGASIDLN